MSGDSENQGAARPNPVFATTHWSVVLDAQAGQSPEATEALARLCRVYWYPLYAYVRRHGYNPDEAQDLTQEFFARLLAKNYLRSLDRQKGRFRSFLLAAMEHFLAKEWRDARRLKRGGGQIVISLDANESESRYRIEPVEKMTAERIFERRWAFTLLEESVRRLRREFTESGRERFFDLLQPFLSGERQDMTYAQVGADLDMSEGAVKVAVHRLRQRYGEVLREEIASTLDAGEDIDAELRHLLHAVSNV